MAKLPEPPDTQLLIELGPDIRALAAGTWLWRVYFRDPPGRSSWNTFRAYGPVTSARFDHQIPPPSEQDRAIMYVATDPTTCFAEVFQRTRRIHRTMKQPWVVGMSIERDLRLLDLTGQWPTKAGASMAINSGRRDRARAWSRAIYDAYPEVDGLLYGSSMNANLLSIALYERSGDAIPMSPLFHRALGDPVMATTIMNAARSLGYVVI